MSATVRLFTWSLVVLAALAGCESQQQVAVVAEPVTILSRSCGQNSDLPLAGIWLVQSQDQLAAIGSTTLTDLQIDFAQYDLAVVALGEQTSGGYWVCIKSIQQVDKTLYIQGTANAPVDGAAVTDQMTQPYCTALIAKTSAQVVRDDIQSVQGKTNGCWTTACDYRPKSE